MTRSQFTVLCCAFVVSFNFSLRSAVVSSTYAGGGGGNNDWSLAGNWSPAVVPNNGATDQYEVTIPNGLSVDLNQLVTINSFTVGFGATTSIESSRTLSSLQNVTNNGLILASATSSSFRFAENDDFVVAFTGSGTLRLANDTASLAGTTGNTLVNPGTHTLEGYGLMGNNNINFDNLGLIQANAPGETLILNPSTTVVNTGTVQATNGGILRLAAGTYSGAGTYAVGDNATIELSSGTLDGIHLSADSSDGTLSNNLVELTSNTNAEDLELSTQLKFVSSSRSLILSGDFTNNGVVDLGSGVISSALSFSDSIDQSVTVSGTGSILLSDTTHRISGSTGHSLILGAMQTVSGFGLLGSNSLNIVNQGTIIANNSSGSIVIDPFSTFENQGSLRAETGGKLQFNVGTYTNSPTASLIVSDGSQIVSSGATFEGTTFTADNLDADLSNNELLIPSNSTFTNVTQSAQVSISANRSMAVKKQLTNNGVILTTSTSSNLSFSDPDDQIVSLLGTGSIQLSDDTQRITGASGHTLIHGSDHTIEGYGAIGSNALKITNQGDILANVAGETLILDPSIDFVNDGTLRAFDGATLRFNGGTYTGSGSFLLDSNGAFRVGASTFEDITLTANDLNNDPADNTLTLTGNSSFKNVVHDLGVIIGNVQTLTVNKTMTNNGSIAIGSSANLSFADADDSAASLDGTGTVTLDVSTATIRGTSGLELTIGSGQAITGTGLIGSNSINLIHNGSIAAELFGDSIAIDPASTFVNNGTVRAGSDATIVLQTGTYSGAGNYFINENGSFTLTGGLYQNLSFSANDANSDPSDNLLSITGNLTFKEVSSTVLVTVPNVVTLTLDTDYANNGSIQLVDGGKLSIRDTVDQIAELNGTGTTLMANTQAGITGSYGHTLIVGANQDISGFGRIGFNSLNLTNNGRISADTTGQKIQIDPAVTFTNNGELHVASGATLEFLAGTYDLASGGTLTGSGTVITPATPFTNSGTISPGNSIGTLTIEEMTHTSSAVFEFEVNGLGNDLLIVDDDVTVAGTLRVNLIDGFVPNDGDTYIVMTSTGELDGSFINIESNTSLGTWIPNIDEVNDQVTVTFELNDVEFSDFQSNFFTAQQILDGDADADNDFDLDGISNFGEWIFGFDPTDPTIPLAPSTITDASATVKITYLEAAVVPSDGYTVTVLTDTVLPPNTPISPSEYNRILTSPSGLPNIYRVTLELDPVWASDPKRFFRLQFAEPEPE